jgi:hypothetical protein
MTALRGYGSTATRAEFSADGTRILTTSAGTGRIWDAETGKEITGIALDAAVTALAIRGGNIALGDALGRIHVFECGEFLNERSACDRR